MLKVQSVLTVAVALALASPLAGCQGAGGLPGLGGPGAAQPSTPGVVSYAGNGALEVVSTDPRPITRIEVIGPSGPIGATVSVHRETVDPNPYGGQVAAAPPMVSPFFGVGFGTGRWSRSRYRGSGVYLGVPPYGVGRRYPYPGAYQGYGAAPEPRGGAMRSTARVTLDDPAAYERQWRNATVRVHYGDAPDATDLPAPAPSR